MLKAHFFLIFPLKQAITHHCALCLPSTFLRLRKRRQSEGRVEAERRHGVFTIRRLIQLYRKSQKTGCRFYEAKVGHDDNNNNKKVMHTPPTGRPHLLKSHFRFDMQHPHIELFLILATNLGVINDKKVFFK